VALVITVNGLFAQKNVVEENSLEPDFVTTQPLKMGEKTVWVRQLKPGIAMKILVQVRLHESNTNSLLYKFRRFYHFPHAGSKLLSKVGYLIFTYKTNDVPN
jgi:hypothetical protein